MRCLFGICLRRDRRELECEKERVTVVGVQVGNITLMPLVQLALMMNSEMDCTWTI